MERPEALIERLPGCLHWSPDGEIRVMGHRISLYSVINRHQSGRAPEEILAELPTLSLDEIRKIIAFYHEDQEEAHLRGGVSLRAATPGSSLCAFPGGSPDSTADRGKGQDRREGVMHGHPVRARREPLFIAAIQT